MENDQAALGCQGMKRIDRASVKSDFLSVDTFLK